MDDVKIARRDGVGIEQAVGLVRRFRASDAAVDDNMGPVNWAM